MLDNTKSGSILLFHNDLQNTTEALPNVLKGLKEKGFEFVTVDELILHENFTIDANGEQQPTAASIKISEKKVEEVMAQYHDELSAAGVSDEQLSEAVSAIKNGDLSVLPEELRPLAQEVMAKLQNGENPAPDNSETSDTQNSQK